MSQRIVLDLGRIFASALAGGRQRGVSVSVQAKPITFELDPLLVAKPLAEAMAGEVRAGAQRLPAAAPATVEARKVAARAWNRGAAWAKRAYPAGPPNVSDRLLTASGHLLRGLRVEPQRAWYAAKAPPGRLTVPEVRERVLRLLRPVVADARSSAAVKAARREAVAVVLGRRGRRR
jgi:hypothetical protein